MFFLGKSARRSACRFLVPVLLALSTSRVPGAPVAAVPPYLHPPSVETYARHDPAGVTILSNGRYLTPAGRHFPIARSPYGMALSRDGSRLFVAS
jgi:hypothetical protein